jgi:SAM-dependent methyltransferase
MLSIPIHKDDDMFHGSHEHYDSVGSQMDSFISHAATLISELSPLILELPCGYGRVTRKLIKRYSPEQIHVAEINAHALKFCTDTFNVTGYQVTDPVNEFKNIPDSTFDIAIMGSLITHLSEQNARAVFKHFFKKVKQGGLGVITTHGVRSRELLGESEIYQVGEEARQHLLDNYDANQFGFSAYKNNHVFEKRTVELIGDSYGISLIPKAWIRDVCKESGLSVIKHMPGAWDSHQDVFFIAK